MAPAQKVVGNLRQVRECIKKNCKKTLKELMHYDKTASLAEELEQIKKDTASISVSEEFDDIDNERQLLEDDKRKFEEEKSKFQNDVMLFSAYMQSEYKRLVTRQQEWLDKMESA